MKYIIDFFINMFEPVGQLGCLLMPLVLASLLIIILQGAPWLLPILIIGLYALPFLWKDK